MQAIAVAAMLKVEYLRVRMSAVATIVLPALIPDDAIGSLYALNMVRIRNLNMLPDQYFVVPVVLPEGQLILTFAEFVAVPNLVVLKVLAVLPQSLTVQFVGTSDGILVNVAPIVAILGPIDSVMTIPKPSYYLRIMGDLLAAVEIAPVPLIGHQPMAGPALPGIPVPAPVAAAPVVPMRITEEEDFRDLQRTRGLFTSLLDYKKLFFLTGEGGEPTGRNITWSGACDAVSTALSNHNRLANVATTVVLSKSEIKQFLVKDYRINNLSVKSFAISGSGHESILIALERIANLERVLTGFELYNAIMQLRAGAREYYLAYPMMPLDLVAESLNAHLEKLRSSPKTDPSVAHEANLAVRLQDVLTFDPTDPTVVGALNSEAYLASMMQAVKGNGSSDGQSPNPRGGGGRRGSRGGGKSKRDGEHDAEPLHDWLTSAPATLHGFGICYDWLQKKGVCANAKHDSKCSKKDRRGNVFVHKYPAGLTKDQYSEIDKWAASHHSLAPDLKKVKG